MSDTKTDTGKKPNPNGQPNKLIIEGTFVVTQEGRRKGTVRWFSAESGYGFIVPEGWKPGDKEIFVHWSQIQGPDGEYKTLRVGTDVEFTLVDKGKGPAAEKVTKQETTYTYWQD